MKPLAQMTIDAMNRKDNLVWWHQGDYHSPVYVENYFFDGMGFMRATVFDAVEQTAHIVHASELGEVLTYDSLKPMQATIEPGAMAVLLNPEQQIVYRVVVVDVYASDVVVLYPDYGVEYIEDGLKNLIHVEGYVSLEAIESRMAEGQVA